MPATGAQSRLPDVRLTARNVLAYYVLGALFQGVLAVLFLAYFGTGLPPIFIPFAIVLPLTSPTEFGMLLVFPAYTLAALVLAWHASRVNRQQPLVEQV